MAPSKKKYLCFAFSFFGFVVGSGGLDNRSPHNVNAKDYACTDFKVMK
jgi:hypothetical protein